MDPDSEITTFVGKLFKVVTVDHLNQTVHALTQEGHTARISGLGETLPENGDTILVSDGYWEHAPSETWQESNSIAIVRSILDEKSALLDNGLVILKIDNNRCIPLGEGYTVEYNNFCGIIRILSEKPIRSRDVSFDSVDVLKEYLFDSAAAGPTFEDFGGYPHVIARARELIETQLKRREYLQKIGARPVKGILFSGPPGTGKTYLARVIAHESKADFFSVKGPSIVSKWVGDTEDTLRQIFEAAANSPSGRAIIFFDEIDSIAERRTGDSHEASKRLVGQLLTLMDGFDDRGKNVVVIAATNRVEALDPALMRPGRFDWEVEFGIPTLTDRVQILKAGANNLRTSEELPIEDIANFTEGWSGAELASLWTETALIAASEGRDQISAEDMAQAYERVTSRPRRSSPSGI